VDFLTIETAFGLNFSWDNWHQRSVATYAGFPEADVIELDGHGRSFADFGWEGFSSLQFMFWF
jgi:hypothetical protein